MSESQRKKVYTLVAEVDPAELAIRLCEANYRLKRPTPNAGDALEAMDIELREKWLRSARAAAEYFAELINDARIPS